MIPSSLPSPSAATRLAALFLPMGLIACGSQPEQPANSRSIACGPVGLSLDQQCTVEAEMGDKGLLHLTLRRPDGGFRRLAWPKGGMLATADGAERLEAQTLPGGGVEARVGGWAYRLERQGRGLP